MFVNFFPSCQPAIVAELTSWLPCSFGRESFMLHEFKTLSPYWQEQSLLWDRDEHEDWDCQHQLVGYDIDYKQASMHWDTSHYSGDEIARKIRRGLLTPVLYTDGQYGSIYYTRYTNEARKYHRFRSFNGEIVGWDAPLYGEDNNTVNQANREHFDAVYQKASRLLEQTPLRATIGDLVAKRAA